MVEAEVDRSTHYLSLAAAFARGRLGLPADLADDEALALAEEQRLRLHRYKRNAALPRVRRVLGVLRGLAPSELLDVGSGRGTFLWPLLDAMPELPVTALDVRPERVQQLESVRDGGVSRLSVVEADLMQALPFDDRHFVVVTALEVLEHLESPERAAAELVRVVDRHVVLTVPSKPDDNPEHLHLLGQDRIESMFLSAGAASVRFDYVLNHLVAVVHKGDG